MGKNERKYYLKFYEKDYDLILKLPTEKIGEVVRCSLHYGATGRILEMSPGAKEVFEVVKKGFDDFWENG